MHLIFWIIGIAVLFYLVLLNNKRNIRKLWDRRTKRFSKDVNRKKEDH